MKPWLSVGESILMLLFAFSPLWLALGIDLYKDFKPLYDKFKSMIVDIEQRLGETKK